FTSDPADFDITQQTVLTQTQIVGETTSQIQSGGKSLEFTATPPCVENNYVCNVYFGRWYGIQLQKVVLLNWSFG
ncbi:hypothetical protein LCGC14_1539090, partial [marine sediment metagenome]